VVGVVLVALAVVLATILLVGPRAPWEEAVLARGRTYLDVPLTTVYTAPPVENATVNTSVDVSYSSGLWLSASSGVPPSSVFYRWFAPSGTDLPVRFVLQSSFPSDRASHFVESTDAFDYFPAGLMPTPQGGGSPSYVNASVEGAGVQYVLMTKWAMDYTVRKMGVFQGLAPSSFLEVDYTLSVLDAGSVHLLTSTNVTAPAAADLVASAAPRLLDAGVPASLGGLSYSVDSRAPFQDYEPFYYNDTTVALDAGPLGTLQTRLGSQSEWSTTCANMTQCWPTAAYTLSLSVSNHTVWFQVYLDRRFGSLLLEYVPPPAV
jgi:hypothetical protein